MRVSKDLPTRTEILDAVDLLLPGQMLEIDGRVLGLISHTVNFFDARTFRAEDRKLYGVIDSMLAGGHARTLPDAIKRLDLAGAIIRMGLANLFQAFGEPPLKACWVAEGHDGTPASSESVPPWDTPCPVITHP
jgi:hypothetical protein